MSYGRRPGTWGMNFLPASTNSTSISHESSSKKDEESEDDSRPKAVRGKVPGVNKQGYNTEFLNPNSFNPIYGVPSSNAGRIMTNIGRKRAQDEDDYFNDDESDCPYQKALDSPPTPPKKDNDDDSDDPLDQFMLGIQKEVKNITSGKSKSDTKSSKGERYDIEKEDELESYLKFMEENPNIGVYGEEEEIYQYDAEGNIVATEKKEIDPLPPVDHSLINYGKFSKNFYTPHSEIASLDHSQVSMLRDKLGIKVRGINLISPVCSFAHFNMDEPLMNAIREAGYSQPTPIQAQAVPVALSGRDIIGIAKTGSGKTAAFLWPMIIHIMDQQELKYGDGPIGIVCAPTRELALQIYNEAKKMAKVYNLNVVCAYGGGNMWEQQKACEQGCEILVCTPGRLIDLVKKKSTNLRRVTYLVFDEADKMFNLGFEPQVRSIANHVRPDRQTLLFSATFKSKIEKLARDILNEPIKIVQGIVGEANEDITQIVEIMSSIEEKWLWLCQHLVEFTSKGSVLIFVTKKANADEISQKLKLRDFKVVLLHGDMHQSDRNSVIQSFRRQEASVLVATDVAARGLDIPTIETVINYEVARDIDTHTHRVGRTGRAGRKGNAFTLFVRGTDSCDFAAHLVKHLETSNQHVCKDLLDCAMKCPWFSRNRSKVMIGSEAARPGIGFAPRTKRQEASVSSSEILCDPSTESQQVPFVPVADMTPTDRLTVMRQAFASQFNQRFVSAGVEGKQFVHPQLHQSVFQQNNSQNQTQNTVQEVRKKKSRWD